MGGVIAIDVQNSSGVSRNWHYDLGVELAGNDYDFYTVVTHELAHLFGFGVSNAFSTDISGSAFTGANAVSLYGGTVPLTGANTGLPTSPARRFSPNAAQTVARPVA